MLPILIIEMYVEDDYTNNHGFKRYVPNAQKKEKVSI